MTSIQFQLPDETIEALRASAASEGITPNVLARMILHRHFKKPDSNANTELESKTYTFATRRWRELEAYIRVKNFGSVESFAPSALDLAMSRTRLSPRQKAELEEIIQKLR
jgi:hypothetical protein